MLAQQEKVARVHDWYRDKDDARERHLQYLEAVASGHTSHSTWKT